ncbi:hypothetical protein [Leptolyngbya sp. FACHB-321]|nr:hypothetical protein [Leptolyngbya sp. FACHB-321]
MCFRTGYSGILRSPLVHSSPRASLWLYQMTLRIMPGALQAAAIV